MFNIRRKCRDAYKKQIQQGWYFHPDFGYIRFVNEYEPINLIEKRFWLVEYAYRGNETMHKEFDKSKTSRCIKVNKEIIKNQCTKNAQWAKNRLEKLARTTQ